MKRFLVSIFLLGTCWQALLAQKNKVDSLQKAYQKNKQDTTLVALLLEKATKVHLQANVDSGMLCARQALDISRKIHYKRGEVRSLSTVATYLNIMGDLPGSLRETFKALPEAIKINDNLIVAQCYNTLGLTYSTLKNYKKSLEYYHKALIMAEKAHSDEVMSIELNNLSRNFLDADQLDSALWYTNTAYALSEKKKLYNNIGYLVRNLGMIRFKKGDYSGAIAYYLKSMNVTANKNNHYLFSEDYRRIAEAYQKLNKLDSCIYLGKKAFEEAKLDRNPDQVLKATTLLTNTYKSLNNYKDAFDYQQVMLKAQDSLFSQQKTLQVQNLTFNEQQRQQEIEAAQAAYRNRVRMYVLLGALGVFILIVLILWYSNGARKKANHLLHEQKEEIEAQRDNLEQAYSSLKNTQTQLIQSEKMASLGELTAGIAHEIQNPLNFVNNFSEVNTELIEEMQQEIDNGNFKEAKTIATDIQENQQKISQHGKRADFIVKGMLQHSRTNTGERQLTNLNILADEFLKLSYHGLRAKDKSFNAELITNFDENLPKVNIVQQDIGRVMLNLFNNAFYAVNQKAKTAGAGYKPEVTVTTSTQNGQVIITVKDNGIGIPDSIREKIMQPFFTTKPTGEGTGLGLSLTYDMVVKGHGGSIQVNSVEGEGSELVIVIPI